MMTARERLESAIDVMRDAIANMPETQEGADAFTSLFEDIEALVTMADKRWEAIINAVEHARQDAMTAEVIAHLALDGVTVDVEMLTQDARDWVETYYMGDVGTCLDADGIAMIAQYRARKGSNEE